MAQIIFHGSLRNSSALAFENGPADKAAAANSLGVTDTTLHYQSISSIAVGDILYTDTGYTTAFSGDGGSNEFFYTSDDVNDGPTPTNKVVEISGVDLSGSGGPALGEVVSVTLGPTYQISTELLNGNQVSTVNENVPFKIIVTETGSPSMKPILTTGGSATSADFNSWPFQYNASNTQAELDFTLGTNPIEINLVTADDQTNEGNETFTVQLTDGTLASIAIADTSTAQLDIEWDDNSALTVATAGGSNIRTFQMTGASQALSISNNIGFTNQTNWNTAAGDVGFVQNGGTPSGGSLNITVPAYTYSVSNPNTNDRSVDIILSHPDDNGVTSSTITITQSGTGLVAWDWQSASVITGNSLQIDFTNLGGQAVSDVQDGMPAIKIASLPPNGTLYDLTANQVALGVGDFLDANNGQPTVIYTPNPTFGASGNATDSFTYTAEDSDGNTLTKTITITVGPPANTAPTISSFGVSVNGYGTQGTSTQFNVASVVNGNPQDESLGTLNYYWTNANDDPSARIAFPGLPSLSQVDLASNSNIGNTVFTLSKPSGTNLGVGQSNINETAYITVEDDQGEFAAAPATVTFTLLSESNDPPVVSQQNFPTTGSYQINQYDQNDVDLAPFISDDDGDGNITLAVQNQVGGGNVSINGLVVSYAASLTGMTQGQTQTVTFEITVADQYGVSPASNHPITFSYEVTPVPIVQIQRANVFASSAEIACTTPTTTAAYLDAANQATTIAELQAGDSIYQTANNSGGTVSNEVSSSSTNAQWLSVFQNIGGTPTTISLQIDTSGVIISTVNCSISTGNAWPIIGYYSDDADGVCHVGGYEQATLWQNVVDTTNVNNATLEQVTDVRVNDIPTGTLFTNEANANFYAGNPISSIPSSVIVPDGFYRTPSEGGSYFEIVNGQFVQVTDVQGQPVTDQNGLALYKNTCPDEIVYQTYEAKVWYNANDRERVDTGCTSEQAELTLATIYFRADNQDGVDQLGDKEKLEYALQNQLMIYTTQELATQVDYEGSWPTTVFLPSSTDNNGLPTFDQTNSKFAIFENDNSSGYNTDYRWLGVNTDPNSPDYLALTVGGPGIQLGSCSTQFDRPAGNTTYRVQGNSDSRVNIFYAFYSCVAKIENGIPYWPLYIVDGLHTKEAGSSSYIKEFVDAAVYANGFGNMNAEDQSTIGGDTLISCMQIMHRLEGVNIEDAVEQISLMAEYQGNDVRPLEINAVDLGLTSGAVINYGYTDCNACVTGQTPLGSYTLATVDNAEIINRSVPNFKLEKNYQLDDLSKPLLRTNPKLSTNAKLVVNSNGKMFIESIEATKELASVEYKKFALSKTGQWSYDLPRFFMNTNTPSDQVYLAKESFSNLTVQETFENQIEEDYHYGTVYNYSKLHEEDLRMMAPIWLDKNIPQKFVIFRVKDPVGTLDFDTRSNFANMKEILNNSEIVKTFDLTRDSELGTYIRNHVQSESFPKNPITVNFDQNERTSFNGIDIKKGGFTSKGEYLHKDFVRQDQTLIASNNLITGGFERNSLACANLMNLEFLFDDNTTSDYSVNRYFGIYVNDIDSGYGTLESANSGKLRFKTLNSYINNDPKSAIPSFKLIDELPTLGYANISEKFYKINANTFYDTSNLEVNVEDSGNAIPAEVKLARTGNSIDMVTNVDPGSDFVKVTVLGAPAINDQFAIFPSKEQAYRLKFTRYSAGDQLTISLRNPGSGSVYNMTGLTTTADIADLVEDLNVKLGMMFFSISSLTWTYTELLENLNVVFEKETDTSIVLYEKKASLYPLMPQIAGQGNFNSIFRFEELQIPYDLENNTFRASTTLSAGTFNSTNFSALGTNAEIATAIAKSINSVDNGFTALTYDGADHLYVKTDVQGYRLLQAGIAIPNSNANQWISIDSNNLDTLNELRLFKDATSSATLLTDSAVYYFSGGNATGKSALVTLDSVSDVNVGDFIETKSSGIYNKIVDIVDDIERLPLQYNKLILEKVNTIESGEIEIYADNLVRLGMFSAFDIHDMNFDFYDTANSDLKELQYETPANIAYEPETDNQNDIYPFGDKQNNEFTTDPVSYFTGLQDILQEEVTDADNNSIVTSEFDRLQENYLKQYAVTSRVVPTINKWVLKDTKTVREQPYYLNTNEAFGRSNFAPDLTSDGRNRLGMTHEWFYLNNLPKYLKENQGTNSSPFYRLNDSFSYINFMDGFEITPSIFKDTNFDYFDRFFVTEGFECKAPNTYKTFVKTNLQKKYTKVDGGNNKAFATTIFKGLKVIFKNRKEFIEDNPADFVRSPEFNGYRFSILLNVRTAQETNDVSYEVIQNKKFKYVVFFINLNLDDLWSDGSLNRKLLYELNHSLVWKGEQNTFAFSDIKLDGSMDLININMDPNSSDYLLVNGLVHGNDTIPQYFEQINKNEEDEFGTIEVKVQTWFGPRIYQLKLLSVEGQDTLLLSEPPLDITDGVNNAVAADFSNMPYSFQYNAEYTYVNGGVNAYRNILDSLAAKEVAEMLLRQPNNVTYTTIDTDGTSSNNRFIILLEDGTEVVKESFIVTVEDDDKPESFKLFSGNIGFDLAQGLTYFPFLIRQNSSYTVDTRPVITFTDVYTHMKTNTLQSTANTGELLLEEQMYKHSLSDADEISLARDFYKRYNRCGVALNLGFIYDDGAHDKGWGLIRNHFYRKVNEFNASGVTKLSATSDKPPLYPLIGEIAIDKKDVHTFRSSWDKNYYTRSLSGGESELVPGTFETKEEKSYLSSTIMKIKDSYTLLNFSINNVDSEEEQEDILLNSTNQADVVVFEDKTRIVMDFYITTTIRKALSTDGVLATIQDYVAVGDSAEDKTTLKDDAELYIDENLVNLFGIQQIKLFTRRIKGVDSSIELAATVDALDDGGFAQDQNFSFRAHEQKPLNFRLIYNKRLGYSYRIKPMIKITS